MSNGTGSVGQSADEFWGDALRNRSRNGMPDDMRTRLSHKLRDIRTGVPHEWRAGLWLYATPGVSAGSADRRSAYEAVRQDTQGESKGPLRSVRSLAVCFGSRMTEEWPVVGAQSQRVCMVLSAVLAHYTTITGNTQVFSPWHPPLVALCLHFLDESDAFAIAVALLPAGVVAKQTFDMLSHQPALPTSRLETWKMLHVMVALLRKGLSTGKRATLHALLCGTDTQSSEFGGKRKEVFDVDAIGGGASEVLETYIMEGFWHLPVPVLVRMVDLFFVDGPKMLFRLVLGVARLCAKSPRVDHIAGSAHCDVDILELIPELSDASALMQSVFKHTFKRASLVRLRSKYDQQSVDAMSRRGHVRGVAELSQDEQEAVAALSALGVTSSGHRPAFDGAATCIPPPVVAMATPAALVDIWAHVPLRFRHLKANLVFSTATDGCRLATLYEYCHTYAPLLVFIRATNGTIVGGCMSHALADRKLNAYYGGGESFVFRASGTTPAVYPWRESSPPVPSDLTESTAPVTKGNNDLFIFADNDRLAMGGGGSGGHAWEVDADLSLGSSCVSTTFSNDESLFAPPHTSGASATAPVEADPRAFATHTRTECVFRIATLEVWTLDQSFEARDPVEYAHT
eukprot:m.995545 g.995545  ORF g.995545 m.995545 type:complete len:628 (+) comp24017_c0_seq5:1616-3499(+)